jgi:protein MBA1
VDIVSIRAGEVYTENAEPVNGHRLLIQALVKFDTTHVSGSLSLSLTRQ